GLLAELGLGLGAGAEERLEGELAVEGAVADAVDRAHAALAELLEDLVALVEGVAELEHGLPPEGVARKPLLPPAPSPLRGEGSFAPCFGTLEDRRAKPPLRSAE